ncbi:hypothetical protein D3C85_1329180 [compost metagenome]
MLLIADSDGHSSSLPERAWAGWLQSGPPGIRLISGEDGQDEQHRVYVTGYGLSRRIVSFLKGHLPRFWRQIFQGLLWNLLYGG